MGFRMRKSFKVMPGVRMTVTPKGVGVSAGTRGARMSVHSSGRVTKSVGVPGSGVSYVSASSRKRRSTSTRSAPTPRPSPAPKAGLFAPKGEKALYGALIPDVSTAKLADVATTFPDHAIVANTVLGFALSENGRQAQFALQAVFDSAQDPSQHPFFRKYLGASTGTIAIADGVRATLPLGRDAVGLALAEFKQDAGDVDGAIEIVEQLEPSTFAAVSLAELYLEAKRDGDVVELTDGVDNEDDATALLCVFRGTALREQGYPDAAREAFKEALRARSRDPAIRHRALFERARTQLGQGRKAMARKDLERIMAEDSQYPGLDALMAQASS